VEDLWLHSTAFIYVGRISAGGLSFDPSPLDNHHLPAQGEKLNAAILSDYAAEFQ
jgi:hypothetical protein